MKTDISAFDSLFLYKNTHDNIILHNLDSHYDKHQNAKIRQDNKKRKELEKIDSYQKFQKSKRL